jgi:SNF2 family DNA or RNA helicase
MYDEHEPVSAPVSVPVLDKNAGSGAGAEARARADIDTELESVRVGISYLPHQESGIRWMLERERTDAPICRGGILGDDMGLGKTFQTIGLLKNGDTGVRTLIICPPALIAGWTEELRACGYVVSTLLGPIAWSVYPETDTDANTVWLTTYPKACTYHRLRIGSRVGKNKYFWDRIVLDEGHASRVPAGRHPSHSASSPSAGGFCRPLPYRTDPAIGRISVCFSVHAVRGRHYRGSANS